MSFRDYFGQLESNPDFSRWYSQFLASAPYESFFWEHRPFSASSVEHDAEFVLIDAPPLARIGADPTPFLQHLNRSLDARVVSFENLRGDAVLVVPRPVVKRNAYGHLMSFVREAPSDQQVDFWRTIALEVRKHLDDRSIWLSTAGLGVSWLHVRLDTRPKYYRFSEYKEVDRSGRRP